MIRTPSRTERSTEDDPSLRDSLAMAALTGLLASDAYSTWIEADRLVGAAYAMADAMPSHRPLSPHGHALVWTPRLIVPPSQPSRIMYVQP